MFACDRMSLLRRADLPTPVPGASIDDAPLTGRWRNADDHAAAPAIREVELIREQGRAARVRMIGVDGFDWGEVAIEQVFAGSPSASTAVGFTASFALADRRARIQANIKLGVMVLAGFMDFDRGRAPTFTRDFCHPEER